MGLYMQEYVYMHMSMRSGAQIRSGPVYVHVHVEEYIGMSSYEQVHM